VLTIPVANVLDGVTLVLGELDAAVTTRRNTVRDSETSSDLRMNTPDQVAVAGRLSSGTVVAFHFPEAHPGRQLPLADQRHRG
jgi:hypothetical protein